MEARPISISHTRSYTYQCKGTYVRCIVHTARRKFMYSRIHTTYTVARRSNSGDHFRDARFFQDLWPFLHIYARARYALQHNDVVCSVDMPFGALRVRTVGNMDFCAALRWFVIFLSDRWGRKYSCAWDYCVKFIYLKKNI